MGIKVTGLDELDYNLKQTGAKTVRGVSEQMRKEAEAIRDLARKFAPIDEGNLEDAIEMAEEGGRDAMGRFTRKQYAVFVDLLHGANGKVVGDYAYLMHEHLTPYGPYGLGKLSQAKQAMQPEMVGGQYLARAVQEVTRSMMQRISKVTQDQLR